MNTLCYLSHEKALFVAIKALGPGERGPSCAEVIFALLVYSSHLFPPSPTENPEGAALYFVSGVCAGLVLTLAALVMRSSCHTDCCQRSQKLLKDQESSSNSSDSEDGSLDAASDISVRRHRRFERTLNKNVFTSVEELERAQRLEERERIIREIWMNGQPEAPGTRSLNRYY